MPYRKKGSSKGKWKTQREEWFGVNNPNYRGPNTQCDYCGKPIRKYPSHANRAKHSYCSHECYAKSRSKHRVRIKREEMRGERHPRWTGSKYCEVCKSEILTRERRHSSKYCSPECGKIGRARLLALKPKKLYTMTCLQCGTKFSGGVARSKYKFCSRACFGKWNSENRSGENSPFWKGGRLYGEYPKGFDEELKLRIRKRDRFTCQICGKRKKGNSRGLDVHHKDGNKDNCSDSNLVSLCRSCHRKEHWRMRDD